MCMQIMKRLQKHAKPEHLNDKKKLTPYHIHKELLGMGVSIPQSNAVSGWEKEGTRRMYLDHFYALEDAWVKITGRTREEFHEINRKEFGAGSKYRR